MHRWAPAVVRRALVLVVGATVGLGAATGASATAAPTPGPAPTAVSVTADDLGWVVTTHADEAPTPERRTDRPSNTRCSGRPSHRRRSHPWSYPPPRPSRCPRRPNRHPHRRSRRHRRVPTAAVVVVAGDSLWAIAATAPRTRRDRRRDRRVLAAVVPGQRLRHRTGPEPDRPRSGARGAGRAGRGHVVSAVAVELAPSTAEDAFAHVRGPRHRPRLRRLGSDWSQLRRRRSCREPPGPDSPSPDDHDRAISVLRARENDPPSTTTTTSPSAVPSADPGRLGCSIALAALEVLAGRRPVAQLARWLGPRRLRGAPGAQRV